MYLNTRITMPVVGAIGVEVVIIGICQAWA